MTVTASQLRTHLLGAGVLSPAVYLADSIYQPPTIDWLLGVFDPWFRKALFAFGITKWSEEAADCDDWADLYASMAKIAHKNTAGHEGTALPVGIVWFHNWEGTGAAHAVVVALCADRLIHFIEPQTGKELYPSDQQKVDTWLVKI